MKLTQNRLKQVLHYNPKTGIFTRKIRTSTRIRVGDIAGYLNTLGYVFICVDSIKYLAHRLVWLYVHGYFPEHTIDHIDRNPANNRITNLREAGKRCNIQNSGNRKDNTSGVKGISWNKNAQKFIVNIMTNSSQKYIGIYSDFDEAVCHRLAAEQCIGWSSCDSNSPAYQYVKERILHL